ENALREKPRSSKFQWAKAASSSSAFARNTGDSRWRLIRCSSIRLKIALIDQLTYIAVGRRQSEAPSFLLDCNLGVEWWLRTVRNSGLRRGIRRLRRRVYLNQLRSVLQLGNSTLINCLWEGGRAAPAPGPTPFMLNKRRPVLTASVLINLSGGARRLPPSPLAN